ncbi:hypothetical protein PFISCL1PPCAC_21221, partial [Pristionchus fissidentatus]
DQSATLIAEQEIDREMAGEEDYLHYCKLIAVGSLQGAHEVWLFDNDKVWRWRGRKGVCDEEATLASTGFGYTSTAVAVSLKSEEEKEECEEQHDADNGDSTRVDFVCVGTREGRIGCWCTIEAGKEKLRETRRFDLNGIGAASRINELSIEVCDPLVRVDDDLAFGIRLYILSDRRVSVSVLRVALTPTTTKLRQVAVHHLLHFVQYPSHLAVESTQLLPSSDHNNNCCKGGGAGPDATEGTVNCRPQRIIVTGGSGFEVLLLCPKKLRCRESPLELVQEELT